MSATGSLIEAMRPYIDLQGNSEYWKSLYAYIGASLPVILLRRDGFLVPAEMSGHVSEIKISKEETMRFVSFASVLGKV